MSGSSPEGGGGGSSPERGRSGMSGIERGVQTRGGGVLAQNVILSHDNVMPDPPPPNRKTPPHTADHPPPQADPPPHTLGGPCRQRQRRRRRETWLYKPSRLRRQSLKIKNKNAKNLTPSCSEFPPGAPHVTKFASAQSTLPIWRIRSIWMLSSEIKIAVQTTKMG